MSYVSTTCNGENVSLGTPQLVHGIERHLALQTHVSAYRRGMFDLSAPAAQHEMPFLPYP